LIAPKHKHIVKKILTLIISENYGGDELVTDISGYKNISNVFKHHLKNSEVKHSTLKR